jgi:hypothetical protein
MVNWFSSKEFLSVQIRLPVLTKILLYIYNKLLISIKFKNGRVSNLIGKEFPCQGKRCRFKSDLTRIYCLDLVKVEGKVAIGKAMRLLNVIL